MSGLNVEELLESTEARAASGHGERHERHDRERDRPRERERGHERGSRSDRDTIRERGRGGRLADGYVDKSSPRSEKGSGGHRSRHRSHSRDSDRNTRRDRRRDFDVDTSNRRSSGGDYYRGGAGRGRDRSRSPRDRRYYREERDDREAREGYRRREEPHDRPPRTRDGSEERPRFGTPREKAVTPEKKEKSNGDERDRRTVFVQQLANRLTQRELQRFFERAGPVKDAQIVKDRVSNRSKGVGYVEFEAESSVAAAIALTGQALLGLPIIVQLTEAEKNRAAPAGSKANGNTNHVPYHRLYVGNIHFNITEVDLSTLFSQFGELEFVQLQKDPEGRSRGYGFVQFEDPENAKAALEGLNNIELAGRQIRVGLGNDKFTAESTANLLQRFNGQAQQQPAPFAGRGGRVPEARGNSQFDRAGGRDDHKGAGGSSALDDTDVGGVSFSNYSRDSLMRRLARNDDSTEMKKDSNAQAKPGPPKPAVDEQMASRCILLKNAFNPANETVGSFKELELDVKQECNDKYGKVVHISADQNTQGDIYIKFDREQGGTNAIRGLNGRFFGGRTITASPVVDAVYNSMFPGAANA